MPPPGFPLALPLSMVLAGLAAAQAPVRPAPAPPAREQGDPAEPARRFAAGRTLREQGRHAEALAELLWCFDHGHRRDRTFVPTRLGAVLDELGALAQVHPPARAELERRRDGKERAVRAGALVNADVAELLALNEVLGEGQRSVRTYDELTGRRPRDELTFFYEGVRQELWRSKRYRTLVQGRPDAAAHLQTASTALREATRRLAGHDLQPDPRFVARVVTDVCLDVEARYGLGDVEAGHALARSLLAFAPGQATLARLIAHLERAGAEEAAVALRDSVLADDAEPAREELAQRIADARAELQAHAAAAAR